MSYLAWNWYSLDMRSATKRSCILSSKKSFRIVLRWVSQSPGDFRAALCLREGPMMNDKVPWDRRSLNRVKVDRT
jgi:hypothetical protein